MHFHFCFGEEINCLIEKVKKNFLKKMTFVFYQACSQGWHGVANATPEQQFVCFLPPVEIFCKFLLLIYFCSKERSLEILVKFNFGLRDILESSIFSSNRIAYHIINSNTAKKYFHYRKSKFKR